MGGVRLWNGTVFKGVQSPRGRRTWRTYTVVAVCSLLARPTVLTWKGQTVSRAPATVLTVLPREAIRALTEVGVHQIDTLCTCRGKADTCSVPVRFLSCGRPSVTYKRRGLPFRHGLEAQWSIFFSQLKPAYPIGH